jgi:hypothetical protein
MSRPVPEGQQLKCKVYRKKRTEKYYDLYLEHAQGGHQFLLTAKKKRGVYFMSSSAFHDTVVGTVKSNFLGTVFTVHDDTEEELLTILYVTELAFIMKGIESIGNERSSSYEILITGHDDGRTTNALLRIFTETIQKWTRRFHDCFAEQITSMESR